MTITCPNWSCETKSLMASDKAMVSHVAEVWADESGSKGWSLSKGSPGYKTCLSWKEL